MNNRSFSEEEMRQREKEERSRLRKQEQAYREAQRGVYSRIYQEQDAMPEDYRAAFWEDPRDRLYDQDRRAAQKGDDWAAERRQIQEDFCHSPYFMSMARTVRKMIFQSTQKLRSWMYFRSSATHSSKLISLRWGAICQ